MQNINELSKMAGDNASGQMPKFDVDLLTLEGEDGYFRIKNKEGEENLGENIKGIMLKVRCQYGAWLDEGRRILFTSEQDSASAKFDLLEITQGQKGKFTNKIATGTGKELKEQYPDLKFKQMIYFLFDGKIVKLQVKGLSLSGLFRTKEQAEVEGQDVGYFNQFGDEHIFQYETELKADKFDKKIGTKVKTFYKIKFVKCEKLDDANMEIVGAKIKMIYDKLQEIEAWRKERGEQKSEAVESSPIDDFGGEPAVEDYEYQG